MGVLDKFLDAIKLNDDYDDDEFLDDEYDDFDEEKPRKKFFDKFQKNDSADDIYDDPQPKNSVKTQKSSGKPTKPASSKITPMRSPKKGQSMEVCVIKPNTMEDTREIADTLISGCTVVLNLEGVDVDLAQRIIDFTLGSCYSLNGQFQKISDFVFILTPFNVDISGDYQDLLNGKITEL